MLHTKALIFIIFIVVVAAATFKNLNSKLNFYVQSQIHGAIFCWRRKASI
jgi:hypothetical protein